MDNWYIETKSDRIRKTSVKVFWISLLGMFIFIGLAWSSYSLVAYGYNTIAISYLSIVIGLIHATISLTSFLVIIGCCIIQYFKVIKYFQDSL